MLKAYLKLWLFLSLLMMDSAEFARGIANLAKMVREDLEHSQVQRLGMVVVAVLAAAAEVEAATLEAMQAPAEQVA